MADLTKWSSLKSMGGSSRKANIQFKEIQEEIVHKVKQTHEDKEVVREMYVDSYRGVATQLGAAEDLKDSIILSGLKLKTEFVEPSAGDPSTLMYLKQGYYLMRMGRYTAAIQYMKTSAKMASQYAEGDKIVLLSKASMAKCHLLMGNWDLALKSAEEVLAVDNKFVQALYAKAESLYNTCRFEQAMVLYYRGLRLALDGEEFRLGIRKCKKIIEDTIRDESIFKVSGIEVFFNLIRRKVDFESTDGKNPPPGRLGKVTVGGLASVMQKKRVESKVALKKAQELEEKMQKEAFLKRIAGSDLILPEMQSVTKLFVPLKPAQKSGNSLSASILSSAKLAALKTEAQESKNADISQKDKKKHDNTRSLKSKGTTNTSNPANEVGSNVRCCRHRFTEEERARKEQTVKQRCREKARAMLGEDRLKEDKTYLTSLSSNLGKRSDLEHDKLATCVSDATENVLNFLKDREEFWSQIDLGKNRKRIK